MVVERESSVVGVVLVFVCVLCECCVLCCVLSGCVVCLFVCGGACCPFGGWVSAPDDTDLGSWDVGY